MAFFAEEKYLGWIDELAAQDYVIIDDFIPAALYSEMTSFFNEILDADQLKKAGIGTLGDHTIDNKIRGDYVYWLDEKQDLTFKPFFEQTTELIDKIRRYCFLSISDFECHLAYYPKGTFYKKHVDQFKERNNRIISFVLYLNPNWQEGDGGELIVHHKDEEISIQPLKNRLVLFKSAEVLHEVALTTKERKSVTGWMLNNPVGLGFLS